MYSMDPVADARAYFDKLHAENEAYELAEQQMREEFIAACKSRDVQRLYGNVSSKRRQSFGDVMVDSLDYISGPKMHEAMQLLLEVAHGDHTAQQLKNSARDLLKRMAIAYASFNVEVV